MVEQVAFEMSDQSLRRQGFELLSQFGSLCVTQRYMSKVQGMLEAVIGFR